MVSLIAWLLLLCVLSGCVPELPELPFFDSYSQGLEYEFVEVYNAYRIVGIGSCTDTELVIPKTHRGKPVVEIRGCAFGGNSFLCSVTIPESVRYIGEAAFAACYALEYVHFSDGLQVIGDGAFFNCFTLRELEIPKSVMRIEGKAFAACFSLERITVDAENLTYHADGNCLIETNRKTLLLGCKNSVIPTDASVTSIGDFAFDSCRIEYISLPACLESIGKDAFDCVGLTDIYYAGTAAQWNAVRKDNDALPEGVTVHFGS